MKKLDTLQKNKVKAGFGFGVLLAVSALINAVSSIIPIIVDLSKPKLANPPTPAPQPERQSRYNSFYNIKPITVVY